MAYQQDFTEDEKNQQQAGQVISAANSPVGSAPGAQQASAPMPQAKGSGFTNLSQYVDANKDQSAQMAGKVTENVRKDLQQVRNDQSAFRGQLAKDTNIAPTNKDLIHALKTNPGAANEAQWADIFKQQTTGYTGPSDVTAMQPYQNLANRVSSIDKSIQTISNPGDVGQLLRQSFNRDGYTAGENTLDNFLTTSGAGADALNKLKSDYAATGLTTKQSDLKDFGNKALQGTKTAAEKTKEDVLAALEEGRNRKVAPPPPAPVAPVARPDMGPAKQVQAKIPSVQTFAPRPASSNLQAGPDLMQDLDKYIERLKA